MEGLNRPRPLAQDDDRDSFDCGQPTLDNWLRRNAWRNQRAGVSRTYVLSDSETSAIAGYVSLAVGEVQREFLPKARQRNMPDPVPIFLLGQLAVDRRWQGRGLADVLLAHAIRMTIHAAETVGSYALVTHPLNETIRGYYENRGFSGLPGDPKGAMFIRLSDLIQSQRWVDGSLDLQPEPMSQRSER